MIIIGCDAVFTLILISNNMLLWKMGCAIEYDDDISGNYSTRPHQSRTFSFNLYVRESNSAGDALFSAFVVLFRRTKMRVICVILVRASVWPAPGE